MKDLIYVTKSDIIILIRYQWKYHIGGLHEKCSLAFNMKRQKIYLQGFPTSISSALSYKLL